MSSFLPRDALRQSQAFNRSHRISEAEMLIAGFRDGGRTLQFEDDGSFGGSARREVLELRSGSEDRELAMVLDQVGSRLSPLPDILAKAEALADWVADLLAENAPARNARILDDIAGPRGRVGAILPLGALIKARTGVCRHRSLLFKVLADRAGVPTALVRGSYVVRGVELAEGEGEGEGQRVGGHAWNEVVLETGERIMIDTMHRLITDFGDPVVDSYRTVGNAPMYDSASALPSQAGELPEAPEADLVRRWNWSEGRIEAGGRCFVTSVDGADKVGVSRLRKALDRLFIRHELKTVELGGAASLKALVIEGAGALRLRRLNPAHVRAPLRPDEGASPGLLQSGMQG